MPKRENNKNKIKEKYFCLYTDELDHIDNISFCTTEKETIEEAKELILDDDDEEVTVAICKILGYVKEKIKPANNVIYERIKN